MPISKSILGMNARNFIYIRQNNPKSAKKIADDKIKTKDLLLKNNIPTTRLINLFHDRKSVRSFDWKFPSKGFVLKPARGYGGEGILVFKSWKNGLGKTQSGKTYDIKQLESHIFDILDGAYSLQFLPDVAYVEEPVKTHSFFKKLTPIGLPDVRIIVFNKVPVMAMLRLPTHQSEGKANLHMGAVGVGIDIRTGITFNAIHNNKPILFIPETKIKTIGIKIPHWEQILLLAATTQKVSRLGYAGIDIVVDQNRGPLVLETNARPGLSIQNANQGSLRTRLERLENIEISTPERGVELAKSLFAEVSVGGINTSPSVLSVIEDVVFEKDGEKKIYEAKLDTGAYRTSLDKSLIRELDLQPMARKIFVKAASGQQLRSAVKVSFVLSGRTINTIATIANRKHLRYPLIVGRRDLEGFLINPEIAKEKEDQLEEDISE